MPRDGSNVYHYPTGIEGVPDQTIESAGYNSFLSDVEQDLNGARPIIAGGTAATNAATALANLGGEKAGQVVTNFDSMTWVSGSFSAASTATGSPVAGHAFSGIVYVTDANNIVVEARDVTNNKVHVRAKTAGVWGVWALDGSSASNFSLIDSVYTLTIDDAQRVLHVIGGRTILIPNDTAVPFPLGTTVICLSGGGATDTITIEPTSGVELVWSGPEGNTFPGIWAGNRIIKLFGVAIIYKASIQRWFIGGNGIT